jgi:hypothetical protein
MTGRCCRFVARATWNDASREGLRIISKPELAATASTRQDTEPQARSQLN